jgi:ABC-2 type transport system permease protein
MRTIATFTPVYGVGEIARSPLTGTGFGVTAVANVILWTLAFGTGAALLYRRDTARV